MRYKIIVAHPGKQHSYHLASALNQDNILLYYITTIYNKKSSIIYRILKHILSVDDVKRLNNRRNKDLRDEQIIQFNKLGGLLETLLVRIDKKKILYRRIREFNSDRFGIKVAKFAIKKNADAVIMYDDNSTAAFKYLKKYAPNIIRIQDVSIAARPYIKDIYEAEIKRSNDIQLYKDNTDWWNDKSLKRSIEEIRDSQYFLVASDFVKASLLKCGVLENQIKIVPYGINVSSNLKRKPLQNGNDVVNFLFVGQVNYRKGVPYLLEAISLLNEDNVTLTITGEYKKDDWFIKKYQKNKNIFFTGLVTPDKMKKIYEKAHVFVLPSFAEGMAQVGLEAMACGLPIICTFNSGLSRFVISGENGFMIQPGNAKELKDKMEWFIYHKDKILQMGMKAKMSVSKYTWEYYNKGISQAIFNILDTVKGKDKN